MKTNRVRWISLASDIPMGQQGAEQRLMAAIRQAGGPGWVFDEVVSAPFGSSRAGVLRLPARLPARLLGLAGRAIGTGVDLIHRFDLRIPIRGRREVLTVHDLPPLRFSDEGVLPDHARESARRAACVVCPSEFAAAEVRELLGAERLWVVPNGVHPMFSSVEAAADWELERLGWRRPFVLHAAGATVRKNLPALARAWSIVTHAASDATLVLCGPEQPTRTQLFDSIPRTVLTGWLPPRLIARLMKAAACVVVPSIYEGFGLPVLEAQAAGTPVVAVDRGALREVSGGFAILVEPDPISIADGILRTLAGAPEIESAVEAGRRRALEFTWERAALGYLNVYSAALE